MKRIFWTTLLLSVLIYPIKAQDSTRITNTHVNNRGRLAFESNDKRFSWEYGTRFFIDGATYFSNQNLSNVTYKSDEFNFSNGVTPRVIRFSIEGCFDKKWIGEFDLDFSYNELEIKDLYIGYKINPSLLIKAGNFKEPFSIGNIDLAKYLSFMERPLAVDAFSPSRALGLSFTGFTNHIYASAGIFGQEAGLNLKTANRGNDGYAVTSRVAYFPINGKNQTLHIGLSGSYRTPDSNGSIDRSVEFRTFPESNIDRRRFVDAVVSNVNYFTRGSAEIAYRYDRLLLQGEYLVTNISRYTYDINDNKIALKNAIFDGWYASAMYTIWGNRQHYEEKRATFESRKVTGKKGTLEAGLRYSYINMNDFHETYTPLYWITGGESDIITAQINWAPINNIRFSLAYSIVDNDKWANAEDNIKKNGLDLNNSMTSGLDFNTLQFRIAALF